MKGSHCLISRNGKCAFGPGQSRQLYVWVVEGNGEVTSDKRQDTTQERLSFRPPQLKCLRQPGQAYTAPKFRNTSCVVQRAPKQVRVRAWRTETRGSRCRMPWRGVTGRLSIIRGTFLIPDRPYLSVFASFCGRRCRREHHDRDSLDPG